MSRPARAAHPAPHAAPDAALALQRQEVIAMLKDLEIAPENLRHGEPADDEVPQLATTILAAGLLQYPTARPGRKGEAPWMLLDGRRRLLALRLLRDAGDISDDHPVRLFVETDRARQAAAVVLTNTAAPVHVADVIAAIGRMLKARLGTADIAAALGYAEIEIRRLGALSALPGDALVALKTGRMTLKQARLLARLSDRKAQRELIQAALEGHGFQEWRLQERLDQNRVTANDPRCRLVDPERYARAGGRLEHDLFDERPPVLLDPQILTETWQARVQPLAAAFEALGFEVRISAGDAPERPEDMEAIGWCYGAGLDAHQAEAWKAARAAHGAAVDAASDAEFGDEIADVLSPLVHARIARDQAAVGGRVVTVLVLTPSSRTGVDIECWTPVEAALPQGETEVGSEDPLAAPFATPVRSCLIDLPEPAPADVGHALHAVRTDIATRGLIRAVADHPEAALSALLARLFSALVLKQNRAAHDAALAVTALPYASTGGRIVEALDGVVRARLETRRLEWESSGLTALAWVHGLEAQTRSSLLAELIALTLDLREGRADGLRMPARAAAAELAELCGARIGDHWTPDGPYLRSHGKPELVEMLVAMEVVDPSVARLKKTELCVRVEAEAATRRWTPPQLDWTAPGDVFGEDDESASEDGPAISVAVLPPADGTGGFMVTPLGEAELSRAVN
ncbi:MAG: chromosome partitioning protein ParB [Brevundimonas sp.]|nr:MAG: chromosome partitioning protein ParB [Brevundimonas sp.]